jgi:hypothetical protein
VFDVIAGGTLGAKVSPSALDELAQPPQVLVRAATELDELGPLFRRIFLFFLAIVASELKS